MPHIIMEYSAELAPKLNVSDTLRAMHCFIGGRESVGIERVKSRAIPLNNVYVGAIEQEPCRLVHICIKLIPGRDESDIALMTSGCRDIITEALRGNEKTSVSVEAVDLSAQRYCAEYAGEA